MADTTTRAIRARYLDCCTSGFFSGSSAPQVISAPVCAETTLAELAESLFHDFRSCGGAECFEFNGAEEAVRDALNRDIWRKGVDMSLTLEQAGHHYLPTAAEMEADDWAEPCYIYVGLWPADSEN